MIDAYLNQTVVWEAKTGTDENNDPAFAAPVTIKARVEYSRKMVRSRTGQDVISEAVLVTRSAVKPDDRITFDGIEWPAIVVANASMLDGYTLFYEVRL